MPETLTYQIDGDVAGITLDRPDVLNAMNTEMILELGDAVDEIVADENVRIVRIEGRGDAFSAGFDLTELEADLGGMSFENFERHATGAEGLQKLSRAVNEADSVFVAEVQGYALGAGLELAVISDIAVAAESATFGFPETEVGLSITNGVTNLLPRAIGLQPAKLMVLAGERISGREAAEMGLVADAVPADRLADRVDEIVESILGKTPSGTVAAKDLLNAGREVSYEESLERELNWGLELLRTEEYQRSLSEFFE